MLKNVYYGTSELNASSAWMKVVNGRHHHRFSINRALQGSPYFVLGSYQPTTQSTSDCHISPQNTPCPTERPPTSHPAKCVYCPDSDETVEHFLFHCPLYDNIRTRLLPAQPNIHNTLYGSTTQLQRTATYNNMSAMKRRDKIVRSLGEQER